MRLFLKIISYIFHPILNPVVGCILYFMVTPKYSPIEVQSSNVLPIFILTVIVPIICFYILKNMGVISSVFLTSAKERKYPFMIQLSILLLIMYQVLPTNYVSEIYYYFLGLVAAYFTTLVLLLLKFKTSVHLLGLGSLLMYSINLSVHFETNITILIAFWVLTIGFVASSRLYLKAHNLSEICIGLLIGLSSQLLTLQFWL